MSVRHLINRSIDDRFDMYRHLGDGHGRTGHYIASDVFRERCGSDLHIEVNGSSIGIQRRRESDFSIQKQIYLFYPFTIGELILATLQVRVEANQGDRGTRIIANTAELYTSFGLPVRRISVFDTQLTDIIRTRCGCDDTISTLVGNSAFSLRTLRPSNQTERKRVMLGYPFFFADIFLATVQVQSHNLEELVDVTLNEEVEV